MKITGNGSSKVNTNGKWNKTAQIPLGPAPGSAAPVSPDNPRPLPQLHGCTVTLGGSMLDIENAEMSIALNLTPEQVQQMVHELQHAPPPEPEAGSMNYDSVS